VILAQKPNADVIILIAKNNVRFSLKTKWFILQNQTAVV